MASKTQRKLQKRKEREKEAHQKVLARREVLRASVREERDEVRKEKRIKKLQKDLERFDQIMSDRELGAVSEDTISQLERNVEILKKLEDEYNREMLQKQEINEELEKQGYLTLEEKMEALRSLNSKEENTDCGVSGSAECKVSANSDTAEVSVIKAPVEQSEENS